MIICCCNHSHYLILFIMNWRIIFSITAFLTLASFGIQGTHGDEGDKIQGNWMTAEDAAKVQIYKAVNGKFAGKYYGKVIWLKEPEENGKPKLDKNNPDVKKRSNPLMGIVLLRDFVYDADDKEWNGGTIYDPKNGKTYNCYISMDGNKLNVRGYIGISLIGRTAVWTRVD